MKRAIALALTLCLLCVSCTALAAEPQQAVRYVLSFEANGAELEKLLGQTGAQAGYGEAVAALLNSMVLSVTCSQDGAGTSAASLSLKGEEVISAAVAVAEDGGMLLQSGLYPDTLVYYPADQTNPLGFDAKKASAVLQGWDWAALGEQLQKTAQNWLSSSTHSRETGTFYGDAYGPGSLRYRYELDDRDIALLLLELTEDCEPLLRRIGEEAAGQPELLLDNWRRRVFELAKDSPYTYSYTQVYDGYGAAVGTSLTMNRDGSPQMTLSVGAAGENGQHIVLGIGTEAGNYYLDIDLQEQVQQERFRTGSSSTMSAKLLFDAARGGYLAVADGDALATVNYQGSTSQTAVASIRSSSTAMAFGGIALQRDYSGSMMGTTLITRSTYHLEGSEADCLTCHIVSELTQPVELALDTLTQRSYDDPELERIGNNGMYALNLKLFQLLPAKLIVLLNNYGTAN